MGYPPNFRVISMGNNARSRMFAHGCRDFPMLSLQKFKTRQALEVDHRAKVCLRARPRAQLLKVGSQVLWKRLQAMVKV